MGLAVETTASTTEIWVIVIVMSVLTLVLAGGAALGGRSQRKVSDNRPGRPESPAQAAGDVAVSEPHQGPVTVPPPRSGTAGAGTARAGTARAGTAVAGEVPYAGSAAQRDGGPGRGAPGALGVRGFRRPRL